MNGVLFVLVSLTEGAIMAYVIITIGHIVSNWREFCYVVQTIWYMKTGQYLITTVQRYGNKSPAIIFKDFGIKMLPGIGGDGNRDRIFHFMGAEEEDLPDLLMIRNRKLGLFDTVFFLHNIARAMVASKLKPMSVMLEDL